MARVVRKFDIPTSEEAKRIEQLHGTISKQYATSSRTLKNEQLSNPKKEPSSRWGKLIARFKTQFSTKPSEIRLSGLEEDYKEKKIEKKDIDRKMERVRILKLSSDEKLDHFWRQIQKHIGSYQRRYPHHAIERDQSIERVLNKGATIVNDTSKSAQTRLNCLAGMLLEELNWTEEHHEKHSSTFIFTQSELAKSYVRAFKDSMLQIDPDYEDFLNNYKSSAYYSELPEHRSTFWTRNKGKILTLGTVLFGGVCAGAGILLTATGVLAPLGLPLGLVGAGLIAGGSGLLVGSVFSTGVYSASVYKQNHPPKGPKEPEEPKGPEMEPLPSPPDSPEVEPKSESNTDNAAAFDSVLTSGYGADHHHSPKKSGNLENPEDKDTFKP